MPKIEEIKPKEPFKKNAFRPWDQPPASKIVQTPNLVIEETLISSIPEVKPRPLDGQLVELHPDTVKLWKYKDRPENELGDIDAFAKELASIGQQQPGIVRITEDPHYQYELIIGERRLRACRKAGILFKAILKSLSDNEASLAQAAENEEREQLSDYAKGMSYAKQIEDSIIKQTDLIVKLGLSKQQISRLLSFRDIPQELMHSIGDMTKVSARTAEEIKLLCKKDPHNITLLMGIAEKISAGIGHNTIKKLTDTAKLAQQEFFNPEKVLSKDGRHLFTWRKDGNGNLSISFPKDIRNVLDTKKVEKDISISIEQQIKLKLSSEESPRGDS